MIVIILKLLLIVFLAFYSSITDIKEGIVKNRMLLIVGAFGLSLDLIGWIVYESAIVTHLVNIAIVSFLSILLYAFHIWAGGDCKLMVVFSLLVPCSFYPPIFSPLFRLPFILAITFGLSYIYLLFDSLNRAIRKKEEIDWSTTKQRFKTILWNWISCLSYIILLDQIILYFFSERLENNSWILLFVNIAFVTLVSGIPALKRKWIVFIIVIIDTIIKITLHQELLNKTMLINYSIAIVFIVLRLLIDNYNYETIETNQVKRGMILSASASALFINSRIKGLPSVSTEDLRSRLTEEEAASVRRWGLSTHGTPNILIVRKIPFAIFLSLGTVSFMVIGVMLQWLFV